MIDWSGINRVTVVMPTWIGDVCMATPALRMLRSRLPAGAHITAAIRHGMRPLLRGSTLVDHTVRLDPRGLTGPCRAGRVLASTSPDAILVLPGSFRSALAARLSGCRKRQGYARDARSWLLSPAITPPDRKTPVAQVAWYARLVDDAAEGDGQPPHLVVTDEDRAEAAAARNPERPSVVLVPAATRTDKCWPLERFAAVANALHERFGWQAIIAGGPSERDVAATLAGLIHHAVVDLADLGTSLGALKSIMKDAELVVSIDTGPRHVAIAVGTPVISLFGPTDHRWTLIPEANERRLLACPFLPDALTADRHAAMCSMDRIAVRDVLAAVDAMNHGRA